MNAKETDNLLQYTACGLDNVYLRNGYRWTKLHGERALIVEDIEGLHRAIATVIVDSSAQLDAKTFRFLRKGLDMSQRQLAAILDVDEQTVSLWERARMPIPRSADIILRTLTKETCSGNAELQRTIDRINTLDRDRRELEAKMELELDGHWELARAA